MRNKIKYLACACIVIVALVVVVVADEGNIRQPIVNVNPSVPVAIVYPGQSDEIIRYKLEGVAVQDWDNPSIIDVKIGYEKGKTSIEVAGPPEPTDIFRPNPEWRQVDVVQGDVKDKIHLSIRCGIVSVGEPRIVEVRDVDVPRKRVSVSVEFFVEYTWKGLTTGGYDVDMSRAEYRRMGLSTIVYKNR